MKDSDTDDYVTAVLTSYLGLPETPLRAVTSRVCFPLRKLIFLS